MPRNPHSRRIEALIHVWGEITSRNRSNWEREELVSLIKSEYSRRGIEPLRGYIKPPDIYDKELAALYAVGKHGLGLSEEYAYVFNTALKFEQSVEELLSEVLKASTPEEVRSIVEGKLGSVSKELLVRILRIPFTEVILGFRDESEFIEILRKLRDAFPEHEGTLRNYTKFYIAFKVADSIARGEVRSRLDKEALKRALAIRVGFNKVAPSDEYIRVVASEVLNVPRRVLRRVLSAQHVESRSSGKKDLLGLSAG